MTALDFHSLQRRLREQGWKVRRTAKGHYKAKPPNVTDGRRTVLISDSGDPHALLNNIKRLEKCGFVFEGPRPPKRKVGRPRKVPLQEAPEPVPEKVPEEVPVAPDTGFSHLVRLVSHLRYAVEYAKLCEVQVAETMLAVQSAQRKHDAAVKESVEANQSVTEAVKNLLGYEP